MRLFRVPVSLCALALTSALGAQGAPPKGYQFAIEDYARAERFLGQSMNPLVSGTAGRPTWLADGRFWYRASTTNGSSFFLVNPAKRTRTPAFDHTRLASALGAATGGTVEGDRLPLQTFDLAADGKSMDLSGWVTLTNASGVAYRRAQVQLVAGEVNQVQPLPQARMMRADMAMAAPAPSP